MSSGPEAPARRSSFVLRLNLWYASLLAVALVALLLAARWAVERSVVSRDRLVVHARVAAYAELVARGGVPALEEELARRGDPEVRVEVRDRDGHTLVDRGPRGTSTVAVRQVADLRIEVRASAERRAEILGHLGPGLALVALGALVAAFVGGALLTRQALRPVRAVAATARRVIRSGDLTARVPARPARASLGELDELVTLVNGVLARNERLVVGMRQALDDVAHDLRTPLTRLRTAAELALRGDDVAALREALATTVEESEHVLAMLRTLMDVSQAEAGLLRLERRSVAAAAVVGDVADLYEHVAAERGLELGTVAPAGLEVWADPVRLRQALANLVDNAVKYAPAGTAVTIEARRDGEDVVLAVVDRGPGVPPEERPRVWERLYRGDRSRSRPGLGLGLSLVKAIVEAHGGAVALEETPGGGATFAIRLPSTAPAGGDASPGAGRPPPAAGPPAPPPRT